MLCVIRIALSNTKIPASCVSSKDELLKPGGKVPFFNPDASEWHEIALYPMSLSTPGYENPDSTFDDGQTIRPRELPEKILYSVILFLVPVSLILFS